VTAQRRTALVSVLAAVALLAVKLATGLATGSLGLISEAIHSGTDLVAALLTFFAVGVAARPADVGHAYGHGKAEHLAALGEGGILVLASLFVAGRAVMHLAGGAETHVDAAWYALVVLAVVIAIDASRTVVSWRAARRFGSPALQSNALHFASDLVGSTAVLIGLLLVRAGAERADSAAALFVAVLVLFAAGRLMRTNVDVLMDRVPAEAEAAARAAITGLQPEVELRRLRMREAGGRQFADVVIGVSPEAAVGQGHAAADRVEEAVQDALPGSDVVVHVEPGAGEGDLRERASAAALTVRGVREVHNVRVVDVEGRPELSLHLKLPAGLELGAAHDIACAVEAAINRAVHEVIDVHTHIEPLSAGAEGAEPQHAEVADEERIVRDIVRGLTGAEPEALRFRAGAEGLVVLLTVRLAGTQTLDQAHDVASELERRIRREAPSIDEVIVHTEPGDPRVEATRPRWVT
jgi:cation diffusion facilitator family transporter